MTHNDAILYSGITSVTAEREAEKRELRQQDKQEKRQKLLPVADIILADLTREKAAVMTVTSLDISGAKDERMFMVEMMARQKYVEYLNRLEVRLSNILKDDHRGTTDRTAR